MSDPYDDAMWDQTHGHWLYCRGCTEYVDPDAWTQDHDDHEPDEHDGYGPQHGEALDGGVSARRDDPRYDYPH